MSNWKGSGRNLQRAEQRSSPAAVPASELRSCSLPSNSGGADHFNRIRRIKCDESRPACRRCASTGRSCDGYGIWGGGAKPYAHRFVAPKDCNAIARHTMPVFTHAETTDEKDYLDWFKCRTSAKIPGVFLSSFWHTLVFQASSNEPAVMHAVLAISSVHKRETVDGKSAGREGDIPDDQEQFALRQYSKAISCLQPHFSVKNRASIRVALVTCVVFICLEFLRGHYQTAQAHLQNGLKLLRETEGATDTRILIPNPARDLVDDWIIEAFLRLHMQVELLQGSQHPHLIMDSYEAELPVHQFQSLNHARRHLYRLMDEIFHLSEQAWRHEKLNQVGYTSELLDRQEHIRARLALWLSKYKASRVRLQTKIPLLSPFAYQLLHMYHNMADIMAHTCLGPACELILDSHTDDFVSIVMRSIELRKTFPSLSEKAHENGTDKSKTIIDMGWIPPLYYTAIKCRIHRVRLQAIKLLASASHREGIWDARTVACVARKVMEIEERDFYEDMHTADDFHIYAAPEERDYLLPALPDSHRVHKVHILLPDDLTGNVVLVCKQRQGDGSWIVLMSECDVLSGCWVDREVKRCASEL
jgi:hypothetical protein